MRTHTTSLITVPGDGSVVSGHFAHADRQDERNERTRRAAKWMGRLLLAALVFLTMITRPASAQIADLLGQGNSKFDVAVEPKVVATLKPVSARPGDEVTLAITVTLPPDSYTSPLKTDTGRPTRIIIETITGLEPVGGDFRADHPPKIVQDEFLGQMAKYYDRVTWFRTYRIPADARADDVAVSGMLDYQVCDLRRCTPWDTPFRATLAGKTGESASTEPAKVERHPFSMEQRPQNGSKPGPALVRAQLSPEDASPGDEVTLSLTIQVDDPWHVYATSQPAESESFGTSIELERITGLAPIDGDTDEFKPSEEHEELTFEEIENRLWVHHGEVTWTRRFHVAATAAPAGYGVEGSIRYQTCTDAKCLRPMTVAFALGELSETPPIAVTAQSEDKEPAGTTSQTIESKTTDQASAGSLPIYLLYAFFGGLILNVMPCVLPVIAIKVMSFVQQAGESRGRILLLNVAYAAGVMSVFLLLATLVAGPQKLGWGGLFHDSNFNVVMACVVFAMGLSLLGVFEIPIPGLVGSAAGGHQREGLTGAFLTGILATLLATPCSGPFLGVTLAWSVQQETLVTYLVLGVMGFGMASPYLVLGMFPAAIKWLPKPGNWMVRLKEFAGFVLMGTVIFFVAILDESKTVPLLIMLLGIALGLWMIGNLYAVNSQIKHKNIVRGSALVLTSAICAVGYSLSLPDLELPWQPLSEEKVDVALANKQTVLIDFTADW
jgi:cytochrome c biogenesis protein CcdA